MGIILSSQDSPWKYSMNISRPREREILFPTEILQWLDDFATGRYMIKQWYGYWEVLFLDEQDAVFFKLRWA